MAQISAVYAKGTDAERKITVEYDLPQSVKEALDRFGEKVVLSYFNADLTVALQSAMRGMAKAGKNNKQIQDALKEWKPGEKRKAKSDIEKAKDVVSKLTPEEKAALLASLKGS